MNEETFVERVKRHFSYLEREFGFKMDFAKNSDMRPKTDGVVKYKSNTTMVLIDSDTGQAAIRFVRVQDNEFFYIDPVSIHEYLNTSDEEKRILLSKNVKDQHAADAIFRKTFLLSSQTWKPGGKDTIQDLEQRLENYAIWLKENANLCVSGNFSKWLEFYEYKINRLMAEEIRGGGKEFVTAIIKDENGTFQKIERPIFQRERDYLEKLKQEYTK
jgi:hypothetical protein